MCYNLVPFPPDRSEMGHEFYRKEMKKSCIWKWDDELLVVEKRTNIEFIKNSIEFLNSLHLELPFYWAEHKYFLACIK